MTAAPPIRWGIAGTGAMAATMTRTLSGVDRAELVAVGSRSAERAQAFATAAGVARGHASYAALVADPEVDVVYVATADADHVDVACAALAAGKHVLVEKPFALDAAGAEQIVAAARSAGRFCMEAMWTRFLPSVDLLVDAVRRGDVGEVRMLVGSLGFVQTRPASSPLLDLGVYPVSLAHLLLGPATGVAAASDRNGLVTLTTEHASGAVAQLAASGTTELDNALIVVGSLGRLALSSPLLQADRVTRVSSSTVGAATADPTSPGTIGRLRSLPTARRAERPLKTLVRRARGSARTTYTPYVGEGYAHEVLAVHDAIDAGRVESERMPWADSIAVLETLDEARSLADSR